MAYLRGFTIKLGADVKGLVDGINSTEASIRELNRETGELNRSLRFDPRNINLLAQKQRVMTERVQETNRKVEDLKKLQAALIKQQNQGKDVSEELRKTNTELEVTKSKLDGYTKALQEVNREVVKYSGRSGAMIAKIEDVGESATELGHKFRGASVVATGAIAGMTKAASDWQTAWVDVLKVTDGTDKQLADLAQGIRDMSKELPVSAVEIAGVVEAASKLGVGIDHVEDFAEVMVKMEIATGISAADSATALARFAEITRMSFDDVERLGSVIAELGDNYATTEREIIDMAMGLAAAGSQVGMHQADIMALATALSTVGLEAQAGGTAMSKLMVSMELATKTGAGLQQFADVAGVSAEEFSRQFGENATKAIGMFIKGLDNINKEGGSAIKTLDDMDIKEVRLRDTLLRAAQASDTFTRAIGDGEKAWKANTKLTEEAALQADTFANKWELLKNNFTDVAIELGNNLLPHLERMLESGAKLVSKFGELSEGTQKWIVRLTALTAIAAPALILFGTAAKAIGAIAGVAKVAGSALFSMGKSAATTKAGISIATSSVETAGTAMAAAGGQAASLGGAFAKLPALLNPTTLALVGAGAAASAFGKWLAQDAVPEVDLFADKMGEAGDTVDGFGRTVGKSLSEISETTKEQVGGFMELSDEMSKLTLELQNGLYDNSQDHTEKMIGLNEEMTKYTIQKAIESKEAQIAEYQELFDNSETITAEQQEMILSYVNQEHLERVNILRETEEELTGIYREIAEQGGVITEEQQQRINELQNIQKEESVNALSETEAEAAVINNRMKAYGERITAEQAANIVQEYNQMRDDTIKASEEQRDETVRLAEEMRAKNPAKFGEMADEMIADANRLHEDTVKAAHRTRDEGIEELSNSVEGLENTINLETGKMKSKLGSFFSRVKTGAREASANFRDMARTWRDTHFPDKYANVHYRSSGSVGHQGSTPMMYNNGLREVGFDNHLALLHKGERVLTANENKQLKQQGYLNSTRNKLKGAMENVVNNVDNSVVNNQFVLAGTYHVREEADVERIARQLNRQLAQKGRF